MKNKSKLKKVYILLVNFNGSKFTIDCLISILKNSYKYYHIVIIDNCSTDNSVDRIIQWINSNKKIFKIKSIVYNQKETEDFNYIKKIEKRFNNMYVPVVIIKSITNNGFAAGNNTGLKYGLIKGDADYFWLLNNDTEIEKNALSEMVNFAKTNDNIGIVGSKLLFDFNRNIVQSVGNDHISWKGIGHGSFDGISNNEKVPDFIEMKSVMGASLLIKTEVIKKIGYMDELFFMQAEESDWCVRAAKAGYKIFVNTKSEVIHKDGKSTDRERISKYFLGRKFYRTNIRDYLMWGYYSFRNEIYFVKKNFRSMFILYCLFILPIKYFTKLFMIFVFNDDYKRKRIYLLNKAMSDGLADNMGKVIDPAGWRGQFN
jgi:GT2 family glycosyltransferase